MKAFKILCTAAALSLLIFSSPVFAAGSDEFVNDLTPSDNSALTNDITLPTDDTDTLQSTLDIIQSDPATQENYDKAAQLFAANNDKGIKVFVDGSLIDFSKYDNVQPVIDSGSTLVPVRALAENLGATVDWDAGKRLITIHLGENVIELVLDSNIAVVNGKSVQMAVPAKTINGRTMIPLRFVSEGFSKNVGWHPYSVDLNVIAISDQ